VPCALTSAPGMRTVRGQVQPDADADAELEREDDSPVRMDASATIATELCNELTRLYDNNNILQRLGSVIAVAKGARARNPFALLTCRRSFCAPLQTTEIRRSAACFGIPALNALRFCLPTGVQAPRLSGTTVWTTWTISCR
jgi:hypothetical protein